MTELIVVSFSGEEAAWAGIFKILEMEVHGELTIYDLLLQGSKVSQEGYTVHSLLQANGFEGETSGDPPDSTWMGLARWLKSALAYPQNIQHNMMNCFGLNPSFMQQVTELSANGSHVLIAEIDELGLESLIGWLNTQDVRFVWNEVDYRYKNYLDEKVESLELDIDDEREKMKIALQQNISEYESRIEHLKISRRHRIGCLVQQVLADTKVKSRNIDWVSSPAENTWQTKLSRLKMQLKILDTRFHSLISQFHSLQNEVIRNDNPK